VEAWDMCVPDAVAAVDTNIHMDIWMWTQVAEQPTNKQDGELWRILVRPLKSVYEEETEEAATRLSYVIRKKEGAEAQRKEKSDER